MLCVTKGQGGSGGSGGDLVSKLTGLLGELITLIAILKFNGQGWQVHLVLTRAEKHI